MKQRCSIRISGFGGQGIVLSGYIVGKAASLHDKKNSAFTQSYGPEARGGACSACVVIEEGKISYPLVKNADFLIVLSKEGYEKYSDKVTAEGLTFVDSDLVSGALVDNQKVFGIPATRLAESMGKKIVANIIMLGFFTAVTGVISKEAMIESIKTSVKKSFIDINLKAFARGCEHAATIRGQE
ncbi:MAG: 2-oxoacid:acceptor oxidoreductase family protein [Candidatus Omnitrophota bacterium]|nr:MAG: 2-oxoacid:acceptor oxidoreductase family protein [Candidatus Omnitrophota bacterium]